VLDQYQGTLLCVVNSNDGSFAECDIVDAVSSNLRFQLTTSSGSGCRGCRCMPFC